MRDRPLLATAIFEDLDLPSISGVMEDHGGGDYAVNVYLPCGAQVEFRMGCVMPEGIWSVSVETDLIGSKEVEVTSCEPFSLTAKNVESFMHPVLQACFGIGNGEDYLQTRITLKVEEVED